MHQTAIQHVDDQKQLNNKQNSQKFFNSTQTQGLNYGNHKVKILNKMANSIFNKISFKW